ncbi:golgi apparatus membrane protein TVP15 [Colletotrichum spaethianum]|uniref:Golgi apparatus membrane protein TVP15 n=1 Tax=Colletotrichum spaethianum TaxID=700344 RepID=A0AA37URS2_9PEZI|nr:golgi apparatus membrane protein TVP15 [Colletotrichum spaethianum]GKT48618.1 golgi apparatus membrane protein TVP15 [Colletotrichum spaethianum]
MELSDAFRIVNLATATIMVLGGIAQFFNFNLYVDPLPPTDLPPAPLCWVPNDSSPVFCEALLTYFPEFQIPPQVSRYASFLFSFIGRGVFYIFIGSILLSDGVFKIIAGSIVGLIGVAYVVLEFVPQIEPPANMREADGGWGAEQV